MKTITLLILCMLIGQLLWSQEKAVQVSTNYSVAKISKDSSRLDIRTVIVNNDSITYYYPKAAQQGQDGKTLYHSFLFLPYHQRQDLTFDVGTIGFNDYDTLIPIPVSDSLIIEYRDIMLETKPVKIQARHYLTPKKEAMKKLDERVTYLDRYVRGVKVIELDLDYSGKKIRQKTSIRNAIDR